MKRSLKLGAFLLVAFGFCQQAAAFPISLKQDAQVSPVTVEDLNKSTYWTESHFIENGDQTYSLQITVYYQRTHQLRNKYWRTAIIKTLPVEGSFVLRGSEIFWQPAEGSHQDTVQVGKYLGWWGPHYGLNDPGHLKMKISAGAKTDRTAAFTFENIRLEATN